MSKHIAEAAVINDVRGGSIAPLLPLPVPLPVPLPDPPPLALQYLNFKFQIHLN